MRSKVVLNFLFLGFLFVAGGAVTSEPNGAPAGHTGSPADGKICSNLGCHSGAVTPVSNYLTTTIPAEGYTPGQTYSLTVTVSGTSWKGFQLSPQKTDGTYLGTLIAGTGTKIVGTKYITHTVRKSGTATWTFQWQAPVAGTNSVDFYAAFADSKTKTYSQKLTVAEKAGSTGVEVTSLQTTEIYPNPAHAYLAVAKLQSTDVSVQLINSRGDALLLMEHGQMHGYTQLSLEGVATGLYLVKIESRGQQVLKKILVQKF